MRSTHTFTELRVSDAAYLEVYTLLADAGYHHAFIDGAIDMHGIALTKKQEENRSLMPMKKHYLLQFFAYEDLPPHLQEISKPFGELAKQIVETLPENPESTTALRKLLEAKDCAVRAQLFTNGN
jgi:hypothetical protein